MSSANFTIVLLLSTVGGVEVVEVVEEGAQHTPLWGACVECLGGGEVGAKFDCLGPVSEEVLYPAADEWGSPRSDSLLTRMSGMIVLKAELKSMKSILT